MLTQKQEKYVQELIKGKSQREAYKIAYPNSVNWKPNSIDNKAASLYRNEKVKARYDELMRDSIEDAESVRKTIIDTEMAIATANMGDLFDVVADEDGMLIQRAKSPEALEKFDMRAVKSYKFDRNGHILLELYDKQPAINCLKEMYKLVDESQNDAIEIVLKGAGDYCV